MTSSPTEIRHKRKFYTVLAGVWTAVPIRKKECARSIKIELGEVAQACNSGTWSLRQEDWDLGLAWSTEWDTVSKTQKRGINLKMLFTDRSRNGCKPKPCGRTASHRPVCHNSVELQTADNNMTSHWEGNTKGYGGSTLASAGHKVGWGESSTSCSSSECEQK